MGLSSLPVPAAGRNFRWQRLEWAAIATAILALVLWFSGPGYLVRSNSAVQDIASGLHQPNASPEIVIIAIDDASIAAIGRWPWRRALHAELLQRISQQGPRAIGMDILFNEEDLDYPGDDLLLAQAIARSARVVLPVVQSSHAPGQTEQPIAALAHSAAALGHVQTQVDSDGIARRFLTRLPDQPWPHLTLAMQCLKPAARCRPVTADSPQHEIIDYAKAQPAFTRYSYIDVLRGNIPTTALHNKYLLIGASATGLSQGFSPPSGTGLGQLSNVDMLAQMLNSTLQQRPLQPAAPWANRLFNAIPVLLALVALSVLGPSTALLVCAALLGLSLLAAGLAPQIAGLQFAPAAALVALLLIYPLWSWRRLNAAAHFLSLEIQDLRQQGLPIVQTADMARGDFLERRISAVEQASRQLRELHHFVSESLLQLPAATFVCDDQGRVLLANAMAEQYVASLGHQASVGLSLPALLLGLNDRNTGAPLLTADSLQPGLPAKSVEGEDRLGRSLLLQRKPLAAGATNGWVITLIDLSAMRQALAQRDQAMHFISHDIRAPIGSIITLLEMQRAYPEQAIPEMLTRIERYAQASLTLADDFMQLARAQHQPLRKQSVDLTWLLEQAMDDSWAQASAQAVQLTRPPSQQAALTLGDSSLLRRAIVNVIGNAIKYGRPQTASQASIECRLVARDDAWALSVHDHGPGIPAEQQSQLFQAFNRLQHQQNAQTSGVGLGLAFVHTVITRHGGQIEVLSGPDTGTTFTLLLPRLPDQGGDRSAT